VGIPEVYRPGGSWRQLTSAVFFLPYYPRAFLAPNGKVFYAGELQSTYYLDTGGNGSWTFLTNRLVADRSYGNAVMYLPGKILYVGGGDPPTASAETIDLNSPTPQWIATGSMAHPRRQMNSTLLPDGRVLVTAGTSAAGFTNPAGAVFDAEVWDPVTGLWSTWAPSSVARTYHSTALLLPDGRVLLSGSGDGAGLIDEQNAELFSPPYLSQGPPPVISSVPATIAYGQTFTVATPDAASIQQVTLVRLSSTTHGFDMGQRFARLTFTIGAGSLSVRTPGTGAKSRVPPGYHMLFILNGAGVPSVARMVRLG
jgi:hypothetical protein